MPLLALITEVLMWLCFLCAALVLYLIRNGRTKHLAGLRTSLRLFACVPIVGLLLNQLGTVGLLPEEDFVMVRRFIQYGLLAVTSGSFVWWLLGQSAPPQNNP